MKWLIKWRKTVFLRVLKANRTFRLVPSMPWYFRIENWNNVIKWCWIIALWTNSLCWFCVPNITDTFNVGNILFHWFAPCLVFIMSPYSCFSQRRTVQQTDLKALESFGVWVNENFPISETIKICRKPGDPKEFKALFGGSTIHRNTILYSKLQDFVWAAGNFERCLEVRSKTFI